MSFGARHLPPPEAARQWYEAGHSGWIDDPESRQRLLDEAVVRYGSVPKLNSGKGKRALLWRYREQFDPGAYADEAQTTGDCVSKGVQGMIDTERAVAIAVRGEPESFYRRSASEPTYGARGHGGQGADPGRLTRFVSEYGYAARENFPGVADLSRYNSKIGEKWGRGGVPSAMKEILKEHPAGDWLAPDSPETCMDMMFNGYPCHSGQQAGFRQEADRNGISVPGKPWNHDMMTAGYDDTQEFYPVTVAFVPNTWGQWNHKPSVWPEHAYGPWIPGMIVVNWSYWVDKFLGTGSIYFHTDITGFEPRILPNLGMSWS